ncbi:hypothetical protein SIO70_23865 [Chitinophaga sancti]|uniref:hypothetical protein n=1 Tax=Chitinophaga sancti TaxID=1004 RepID=UPI002A761652|nr:hypothetical protein [Chitinophaga sancti]WPQ61400.1 hypothetical protein SIO70_23865 [Chitinophaga sancti]
MKTENEITNAIMNTTMGIHQDFPELSKYIIEMPVTIPNVAKPVITVGNLDDYNTLLNEFVSNYSKVEKLWKKNI